MKYVGWGAVFGLQVPKNYIVCSHIFVFILLICDLNIAWNECKMNRVVLLFYGCFFALQGSAKV